MDEGQIDKTQQCLKRVIGRHRLSVCSSQIAETN